MSKFLAVPFKIFMIHDATLFEITSLILEETPADCLVQLSYEKQGQVEQVAYVCGQSGFKHFQGWSLYHLYCHSFPVLDPSIFFSSV